MAENEVAIINHLLDVEHAAETIYTNAQSEAEKKISDARLSADKKFREQYDVIVKDNEKSFSDRKKSIIEKYDSELAGYKNKITSSEKNTLKFEEFLESVLFA